VSGLRVATREDVVREALSWIGTPFHDCACLKGVGTDCLHFAIAVYAAVGMIEYFEPPQYSPQWFVHKDEPLFLEGIRRYAHEVEKPLPGDLQMFNFGRHAAHCALTVDDRTIVHAYKPARAVVKDDPRPLIHRRHSVWSLFV
jgi:NlpC/P60 family putative phage cell wall peptidase